MAFYSGFFNSKGLDRTYTAEDFTSYLSSIICNGILDTYGQMFKLTAASSGLKVNLGTGKAWIDGHYFVNDARYSIDLTSYQDESLPRYVAIAILLDVGESVRSVSLEITPGTPAENPSLPSLPSDENKTRLLMYAVRLNPGATELTERDWYDYREDKNVCGYCKCILGKCKVTELMSQMAQLVAEVQENNETIAELTNKVDTLQTEVDDIIGGIVEIGTCGENIHYVLYENGKLLLCDMKSTFFCIHGNHENRPQNICSYQEKQWHGGRVLYEEDFPNILFPVDGDIFEIEGKQCIVIGGAYSVDKFYRLRMGYKWWPDEQPTPTIKEYVEQQCRTHPVDVVFSHTCPYKYVPTECFLPGIDQSTVDNSTEHWLDTIEEMLDYKAWYLGHWHINKRIDKLHFLMHDVEMLID